MVRASWTVWMPGLVGLASLAGRAMTFTVKTIVHRVSLPGPLVGPRIRVPGPPGGVNMTSPVAELGAEMVHIPPQPEEPPVPAPGTTTPHSPGSREPTGHVPGLSTMSHAGV